jgi:hypothetical protein
MNPKTKTVLVRIVMVGWVENAIAGPRSKKRLLKSEWAGEQICYRQRMDNGAVGTRNAQRIRLAFPENANIKTLPFLRIHDLIADRHGI